MTWRWAISFKYRSGQIGARLAGSRRLLSAFWLLTSVSLFSMGAGSVPAPSDGLGSVTGAVEITNSRDAALRRNYSGVVLWLERTDRSVRPPVAVPKHVQMVQKDRHFQPHVLAIPVGSTVAFPNRDPIYHNAFSTFSGQPFDTGLYKPGTSKEEVFTSPGIVRVFCNIHPTMSAIIAVLPTPWYVLTGPTGKFSITDVPPGEYQLRIFYERARPENLKFLEQGHITVPADGLTLPLISISETGFIPAPHLNKYGQPYPPVPNNGTYPGAPK
jgi:plastocyanin